MAKTVFNAEQATDLLHRNTSNFEASQSKQLIDYLSLMAKWNPVYNLTAIRDTDKMVSHHLLDSLAILPVLQQWLAPKTNASILDVGTGGGLPGVVLAIMRPDWQLTLIDPVHKKTAFLQQVKAQLSLRNLTVITGKVEDLPEQAQFDIITSRAFASVNDFVRLSQHVLHPAGFFAAMKGIFPQDEMDELNAEFANIWQATALELHVPLLNAQRHLIQLKRESL
ncbi:MAG: 16S rRNA (guanine(527)-N(7))-methyltransferase RsmG [Formosimonas sp.]